MFLGLWAFVGSVSYGAATHAGMVKAKIGMLRDNAYGVAITRDDKILVAGATFNGTDSDALLARFLPDGKLDATFGDKGFVALNSGLGDDKAFAITERWDGRIFVAGQLHNGKNADFAVWRFLANGKLDATFGKDGAARMDFGHGDDTALSIALQSDGKVLAGGTATGQKDKDFAMVRLLSNGAIDPGFGDSGKMITSAGDKFNRPGDESGYAILIQPSGKLTQVGFSEIAGQSVLSVVKYLSDGRLDKNFGKDGSLFPVFPGKGTRAYTAVYDLRGRLWVAGCSETGTTRNLMVTRVLPNGVVDARFGEKGLVTIPTGMNQNTVYGMEIDSQGRAVIAGAAGEGNKMNFAIARLDETGKLDTSFASNGKHILNGSGKYDSAYSLAIQSDGKIVTAGVGSEGTGYQIVLLRYNEDGALDEEFGGSLVP